MNEPTDDEVLDAKFRIIGFLSAAELGEERAAIDVIGETVTEHAMQVLLQAAFVLCGDLVTEIAEFKQTDRLSVLRQTAAEIIG